MFVLWYCLLVILLFPFERVSSSSVFEKGCGFNVELPNVAFQITIGLNFISCFIHVQTSSVLNTNGHVNNIQNGI